MTESIVFPYNDRKIKNIALLGYTGVGKTSLIAAGYFEGLIHGKDAFTQKFFQRIENELVTYGEIPLTLGEASTLNFIEPTSRIEFTLQDFSGEHIKLERKEETSYTGLIQRADNANALFCLISARNFYRQSQIHEEIDAIQTFVNKLRGLGTRIPVAVILTQSDTVPRFYVNVPLLKSLCRFLSALPLLALPPSRGLDLTRRRFPTIFKGLEFKGKGPRTVFIGIAIPRLKRLKPWNWPKALEWFPRLMRRLFIDTRWVFRKNYQLREPFYFSFQAFQIGVLRDLLVYHHADRDYCQKLKDAFYQELVEKNPLGDDFFFKEYLDRILEDTQAIIAEVEVELKTLSEEADRLLKTDRDLPQNLKLWLHQADETIRRFTKPWSEGARKSLEKRKQDVLAMVRERLQKLLHSQLESGEKDFYKIIDALKLRRELNALNVWESAELPLPDSTDSEQALFARLLLLTVSRSASSLALFQEDRGKYLDVLTIPPPHDLEMLSKMIEAYNTLQAGLDRLQPGTGQWAEKILKPVQELESYWSQLTNRYELSPQTHLRQTVESQALKSLQREVQQLQDLDQILGWATALEPLLHLPESSKLLQEIIAESQGRARVLLERELKELRALAESLWGMGKNLPQKLREWFQEVGQRTQSSQKVSGEQTRQAMNSLAEEVLKQVKQFLGRQGEEAVAGSPRAVFNKMAEILQLHRELREVPFFIQHGVALPLTEAWEKALCQNLALLTLENRQLEETTFHSHLRSTLGLLAGSPPHYLESLRQVVTCAMQLQEACKTTVGKPIQNWESKVLSPFRLFSEAWTELATQVALTATTPCLESVEEAVLSSFIEFTQKVRSLGQLRAWANELNGLFFQPTKRAQLAELVRGIEEQTRTQFQNDLRGFMASGEQLIASAEAVQEKRSEAREDLWRHFSGSVSALEQSILKFSQTELQLDEKTARLYQEEAPRAFQTSMERWLACLMRTRRIDGAWCENARQTLERGRVIFRHPTAFSGLVEEIEGHRERYSRRRRLTLGVSAFALLLLLLGALYPLGRWFIASSAAAIVQSEADPNRTSEELAQAWQQWFQQYPEWLLALVDPQTEKEARQRMERHRLLTQLIQTEAEIIEGKIFPAAAARLENQWNRTVHPDAEVRWRIESILLELRSAQLLESLQKAKTDSASLDPQQKKRWGEELERLQELEKARQKEKPLYQAKLLEKTRQALWELGK